MPASPQVFMPLDFSRPARHWSVLLAAPTWPRPPTIRRSQGGEAGKQHQQSHGDHQAGMRGVSSRRTREVGSSFRSRLASPRGREKSGLDHSRDLRDADLCPVAQCVGNRSRDTCGAPLSIVVASSAVIGTEGWGGPWTTSKFCAVLPSTTNTYSTNSSAPQGTRGTPRNQTVRWIPGRWRWCGWPRWSRSVARFRPTELRPMPRSMPAQRAAEIVDVLVGVVPVVGLPCVVAAAPKLALALGLRHRRGLGSVQVDIRVREPVRRARLPAEQPDRGRLLHRVAA